MKIIILIISVLLINIESRVAKSFALLPLLIYCVACYINNVNFFSDSKLFQNNNNIKKYELFFILLLCVLIIVSIFHYKLVDF